MTNDAAKHPINLDLIEELNYISTLEEDAIINAFIEQLRGWGFGSIKTMPQLHELFWLFSQEGITLSKLQRVAVVECIDTEALYVPFLNLAKQYNRWKTPQLQHRQDEVEKLNKTLTKANKDMDDMRQKMIDAHNEIVKLKNEMELLRRKVKPQSEGAQVQALRCELKKEYTQQLNTWHKRSRPAKQVLRQLMHELCNPCSALANAYDLTIEADAKAYIEWFRLAQRKINNPTLTTLRSRYEGQDITDFERLVDAYNEEWAKAGHTEDEADE